MNKGRIASPSLASMSRRSFLCTAAVATAGMTAGGAMAQSSSSRANDQFKLKEIGRLKARNARDIASSRIGIGMECLDRRMFAPEKTYDQLGRLGAKWARLQTGWSRCETKEGEYEFSWLDEVVDQVTAAGVNPWFNVGYGNKLYSPDAPDKSAVGQVPLYDGERGLDAWKNFLRALAVHFKGRVKYWEIWNEPNISNFWHPRHKPSAVEYTKLVAISADAIHSKYPEAQITACVAGPSAEFMGDCLKAGMGNYITAFAIHPYGKEMIPELDYAAVVGYMKGLLRQYAPNVKLWQGECGAPSLTTGHHDASWMDLWNMDEMNQAKWLVRRLMLDLFLDLDRSQYFHLCDLMEAVYRQADGSARPPVMLGILNGKTYTPKIAYFAMQSIATLFDDETCSEPGYYCELNACESGLEPLEPYTMLFRRRGKPLLAYYQAVNVQDRTPSRTVDVVLACDRYAQNGEESFQKPVIIDPIKQTVYALPHPEPIADMGKFRSAQRFKNLPCFDYPLLITDESAIS